MERKEKKEWPNPFLNKMCSFNFGFSLPMSMAGRFKAGGEIAEACKSLGCPGLPIHTHRKVVSKE
jgi:hypothetical protein